MVKNKLFVYEYEYLYLYNQFNSIKSIKRD